MDLTSGRRCHHHPFERGRPGSGRGDHRVGPECRGM